MKLLVVNPNTSASMAARIAPPTAAAAGTEIVAVNPESGPASIEGYFDDAFAVPIDTDVASALPTVGAAHGGNGCINPSPRRVVAPPRARDCVTVDHGVEMGELCSQHGDEFLAPQRVVARIPGLAISESPFDGGAFGDGSAGQR
jgi:hypothetical protein